MFERQSAFVFASGLMIIGFVAVGPVSAGEPITAPVASVQVATPLDSDLVANTGDAPAVVYSGTIEVAGAAWLRLNFAEVMLSGSTQDGSGSYLRLTSVLDGGVQTLNATHVEQWQYKSAFFNGDAVLVELIAYPGTGQNRLVINETTAAAAFPAPRSICGPDDDRALSNDPRTGRTSNGCTCWIIDDINHCFLSAGHCASGFDVVEFNVPLSDSNGNHIHAPPEDQYAVDPASVQSNNGGIGNDWAYFGCFANPMTALTPFAAQGDFFVLSDAPPEVAGQTIRITGYGVTQPPVPQEWNFAQKTHTGPFVDSFGDTLQYEVDTSGGNSGSAVFNEDSGEAIGIHTHAGCNSSGGNHGT
ncbi:MAG: trypsin-like peptidase domain-containing protein, partial [Planctomycetota bacterium]|nr:trypsin-like peptidase domain-containing protein [Planctomycetota bacterium]